MEKGTIFMTLGFSCMIGGIYWYAISGNMGILFVIVLGVVCIFFSGDVV